MVASDDDATSILDTAFRALTDDDFQNRLLDSEQAMPAIGEVGLPMTKPVHAALLEFVNLAAPLRLQEDGNTPQALDAEARGRLESISSATDVKSNVDRILMASSVQIRWSFWISVFMSAALFVIGVGILGVALAAAVVGDHIAAVTLGGLSIADFLLLFYTQPRRDIAENLARSQRVHVIATSYLAGLALAGSRDAEALALVNQLTANSVALLDAIGSESALHGKSQQA